MSKDQRSAANGPRPMVCAPTIYYPRSMANGPRRMWNGQRLTTNGPRPLFDDQRCINKFP
eukprot:172969-Lingulodinium_polyedra.AAC.1